MPPPENRAETEDGDVKAALRAGFERQDMVGWFRPIAVLRTALRAVFARYTTQFADRREVQAGRAPNRDLAHSAVRRFGPIDAWFDSDADETADGSDDETRADRPREVWIDYVADIGDGWDSTYTIAGLLGQKSLRVRGLTDGTGRDEAIDLKRGNILVLGGDIAYPEPTAENYRNRFRGPYASAFRDPPGAVDRPLMLAIPGNHDWYDGLNMFFRTFGKNSRVGGWQTLQARSYFAVKLPGNWSLWGNDIALEGWVDSEQLKFFEKVARWAVAGRRGRSREEEDDLGPKPGGAERQDVILCTAKPAWLFDPKGRGAAYRSLWYFESRARSAGCDPRITIAGDHHYYARHEDSDGWHKIVCGGGGAYRMGTHNLPESVTPPVGQPFAQIRDESAAKPAEKEAKPYFESGAVYPTKSQSSRLARGVLRFPFLKHNWRFCIFLGVYYALMTYALRSGAPDVSAPFWFLRADSVGEYIISLWQGLTHVPLDTVLPLLLVAVLAGFAHYANPGRRWLRWVWGAAHGVAHVLMVAGVHFVLANRLLPWLQENTSIGYAGDFLYDASLYGLLILIGGFAGGAIMGVYLFVSNRLFHWHGNETFSAQSLTDYGSFIRMKVTAEEVTMYPLGVRRAAQSWRIRVPRADDAEPGAMYEPASEDAPEVHLIEGPIIVKANPSP